MSLLSVIKPLWILELLCYNVAPVNLTHILTEAYSEPIDAI